MSLFKLFSNSDQSNHSTFPWIELNSVLQLDEIQGNTTESCIIFKHSTRCGISRSVLSKYEKALKENTSGVKYYYLDLLNFRELSNEIANRFKVIHQSPQVIIIKAGKVVKHASHYDILE